VDDYQRLAAAKFRDPHCACGKEVYYTEEAAQFALKQLNGLTARRIIQYGQPAETAVYECLEVWGSGVYHLTSNTTRERKQELQALRQERRKETKK
jgi:hypothetical protein